MDIITTIKQIIENPIDYNKIEDFPINNNNLLPKLLDNIFNFKT